MITKHNKPLTVPLFVPGHRPELLPKAAVSGADAVIIDFEDAVSEADKPAAHAALASLPDMVVPVVVRTNSFDSDWFEKDLAQLAKTPPALVMLPKAESASHIDHIARILGVDMPVIPIIESAAGLAAAGDMLRHPSVLQCAFGHLDFALDIGASPDWENLHYARGKLVVETRLAGKAPPLDGVAVRFDDADIVGAEARRARDMGFGGKLLIHPKQIAPSKAVFRPSRDDYDWALRVMAAVAESSSAVQLDGAMVDVPVIKRAERIISDFEALD